MKGKKNKLTEADFGVFNGRVKWRRFYSGTINELRDRCHNAAIQNGWHTGEIDEKNINLHKGLMISLIHSEISEALEGERKGIMDDHLPDRPMAEVEMADAVIRIMDYCGKFGYDIGGAIEEKLEYNAKRADHKRENRNKEGGKKF